MIDQEINLRVIQKYLGHSTLETTKWCNHISWAHLKKAYDRMANEIDTAMTALITVRGTTSQHP